MVYFRKKGKVAESVDRSHTYIFYGKLYNMLLQSVDRSPRYFHWHDLLVLQAEASLKIVSFLHASPLQDPVVFCPTSTQWSPWSR